MNTGTLKQVRKMVSQAGVKSSALLEILDEDVHDAKSREASSINNGGLEAQLTYLAGEEEEDILRYMKRTLVELKK